MPLAITADEVAQVLRQRGHDVVRLEQLKGGAWSTVFAFQEEGKDYVVRFHDRRDDLEKDRFVQRWATTALRVPEMVEIGDTPRGAYGISRRIGGAPIDDLDEAGMRRILPRLFAAMDAMRDGDLAGTHGYGLWHGDGRAERPSWRDALVGDAAMRDRATQREALARTSVGHLEFDLGIARMSELVRWSSEKRHLVHNDLLYRNVFVDDDGGIVMLDWGASIFGDFLYDVAGLTFWWPWYAERWGGIAIRAEIERHYAEIGLRIPNFAERLRLCELDIGVVHIPYQAAGGEFGNAAWTARRTADLATRDLGSSD